jgi:hypothetical protein
MRRVEVGKPSVKGVVDGVWLAEGVVDAIVSVICRRSFAVRAASLVGAIDRPRLSLFPLGNARIKH